MRRLAEQGLQRAILKSSQRQSSSRDEAFREVIRSVPSGKVSTYGKVAAAAGYPLYHRAVARLLRSSLHDSLPWQRIVGAGGQIKLPGDAALEQRARLEREGVRFRGAVVGHGPTRAPASPLGAGLNSSKEQGRMNSCGPVSYDRHARSASAACNAYLSRPCTFAIISSLTMRGASSYCANCMVKLPRPCVDPRRLVA